MFAAFRDVVSDTTAVVKEGERATEGGEHPYYGPEIATSSSFCSLSCRVQFNNPANNPQTQMNTSASYDAVEMRHLDGDGAKVS